MLKNKIFFIPRRKIEDNRGYFYKVIDGKEVGLPAYTGEVYLTMAKPKEAKGGHFHPLANEWFTLLHGSCLVRLVDMATQEKLDLHLSGDQCETIFIPNNVAHIFINESPTKEFLLLAYTDQLYNPSDTILYNFDKI